jgi:hypothetical protein
MIYTDTRCETCGDPIPAREGSGISRRYCTNKCRQAAYRQRYRVVTDHSGPGWPYQPNQYGYPGAIGCTRLTDQGPPCGKPAPWRVQTTGKRALGVTSTGYYCDEHKPPYAGAPGEVRVLAARELA